MVYKPPGKNEKKSFKSQMLLLKVLTCAIAVLQIANCQLADKEKLIELLDNYLGVDEMQKKMEYRIYQGLRRAS